MSFTVRIGTDADTEWVVGFMELLKLVVAVNTPTEAVKPGSSSLACAALVATAGEILQRCPPSDRGAAVEHYQEMLRKVAMPEASK